MKRLGLCLVAIIVWGHVLWAGEDPKSVALEGDSIIFNTETLKVEATGNVRITYGVTISANVFSYDPQSGDFALPNKYVYRKEKNRVSGKNFYYNVKSYKGYSDNLDARVDRLQISGERMDINPLHLKIKNAEFSTCQNPTGNKHYSVVTDKLYVYPAFGYLVAFNSHVHVKYLPFSLPVPAFIYGAKRYGLTSVTSLLPDMGINRSRGIYLEQKIPYFKSNSSNGGILVGYTEKLGWFAGGEHIQTFDKKNSIEVRALQYSRDTLSGTVSYHYILGGNPLLNGEGNILEKVLRNFNVGLALPMVQVLGTVKYRDIINDQRVSYLPHLQLEVNKAPILFPDLLLTGKVYGGKIKEDQEDSTYSSWTVGASAELFRQKEITKELDYLVGLTYNESRYENDLFWRRLYTQFGFQLKNTLFKPQLIYTHNLMTPEGYSPFKHEQNFALNGNEIGMRLEHSFDRWKNWEILQNTDYSLEDKELRNCDFVIGYRFHCWQMSLRWRAVQQAFGMGFTIY